ncbi:hypothetical protein VTJ04DRAFT_5048 [Mycothermus thermophilus]|uniref:uncharacterized protein n=1 Tax=Humicola insolens TaxID=85995 RepID=UPI00374379A2
MIILLVSLFFILSVLLGLILLLLFFLYRPTKYDGARAGRAKAQVSAHIVVLGDIGRSPRMTYHALSFAKHGVKVNLIGYAETSPHPSVLNNPNITLTPIPTPPRKPPSIPFLLFAPVKVFIQLFHLLRLLAYHLPPATYLLVQNPPSIPTLAIGILISRLRNTKLIIDWHNYGWTILSSVRGASHPLVKVSKFYEARLGRHADMHLTVTHAMARQLRRAPYSIPSTQKILVLHDRPAAIFQPITTRSARVAALRRVLPAEHAELIPRIVQGSVRLVVSSTSWTPDEDFSLLLDALVQYATTTPTATPILAIITGRGPQQSYYLSRISALAASGDLPPDLVRVTTAFLPFADYAALLACADLGVCLHRSSSGVDLPMKVVDMFGAGLPVAAYAGYESFGELVKEGENGRGFERAQELTVILRKLFCTEEGREELRRLKNGAIREGGRRWDAEWDGKVGRVLGVVG